ncbi:hypothetical protein LTR08_005484 [Meristemomyces frigidus]|nr:hypothetical protein LTR08_005484 [Meristemomyces frigidus]
MATAEDTAKQPQHEPGTIDLGGDITLLVGREDAQVGLLVSKPLLSLVSKYFTTLFSATFKEGGDAATGKPIKLEDDDPKAVITLCKILHMQYEPSGVSLTSNELLDLAIVADKYDCVKPLALSLRSIFPDTGIYRAPFIDDANLVCASYLLDHPSLFRRYTQAIVKDHTTSFKNLASSGMGQRLPMALWLKLESKRAKILVGITASLTSNMVGHCPYPWRCLRARAITTAQAINMVEAGLLPLNIRSESISTVLEKMAKLKPVHDVSGARACTGGCPTTKLEAQTSYDDLRAQYDTECTGLCLDCVKAGGKNEGKCRIEHA